MRMQLPFMEDRSVRRRQGSDRGGCGRNPFNLGARAKRAGALDRDARKSASSE